jgi:YVTN family beta-propeller protein
MRCRRPTSMTTRAVIALALATGLGVGPGVVASAQAAIGSPGGAGTVRTNGQRAAATINGCAYVTNAGSDTVSVINTRTNRVVADVPVAPVPAGIAITRNGRRVYVTHGGQPGRTLGLCDQHVRARGKGHGDRHPHQRRAHDH